MWRWVAVFPSLALWVNLMPVASTLGHRPVADTSTHHTSSRAGLGLASVRPARRPAPSQPVGLLLEMAQGPGRQAGLGLTPC